MAFHVDCYTQAKGRAPAKSFTARHDGTCVFATDGKCLHGGQIKAGQAISWARRGFHATQQTQTQAQTSNGAASAATIAATIEESETEGTTDAVAAVTGSSDPIAAALIALLLPVVEAKIDSKLGKLDPAKLVQAADKLIQDKIDALTLPRRIEVSVAGGDARDVGLQHHTFPVLMAMCAARLHVWLAGPAGSGKTTAAQAVAKALGLPFYFAGAITDGYALTGYNDAHGKYVPTLFRQAWEHGGVFLQDEVDGSDPNAVLTLNAALANGHAAFPDRVVERHPDCIIIAAANTYGHGATHEYVGRLKLDGAFLDRFVSLAWDYDDALERALCADSEWCAYVQSVRARVRAKGLRVLVTPRASYYGAKLLAAGVDRETVIAATIRKGMTPEQWDSVK